MNTLLLIIAAIAVYGYIAYDSNKLKKGVDDE